MKRILIFIIIISAFMACEDVNEMHEKYLREGSPIYAGKIDSLSCFSGYYRVKASVFPSIDVNRKEFRIYWNNFNDSVVFSYDASYFNADNGRYEVIVEGFESQKIEGYTTLTFVNFDQQGNKSRKTESTVLIYGDDYATGILNQGSAGFDGQFLNFTHRNNAVGLLAEYTTNEGTQSTVKFNGEVEKLKIIGLDPDLPDFKSGTKVKFKTMYHLEQSDIDSIYAGNFSETDPIVLPDPIIVDSIVNKYGYAEDFNIPVKVYEGETFASVSDQSWCTITADNESGNIQVSIEENVSGSRTATITVNVVGKTGPDFTKEIKVIQSDATKLEDTKSGWTKVSLSDENWEVVSGWGTENLWNGSLAEPGYHTKAAVPTPLLISVNFGKSLLIDGLEIVPRQRYVKNPEVFEVWVSNTENEVGVDRYSDEWETKAVEAGWAKIKTVDWTGWKGTDTRIAYIGATEKYQYMRIRVLKNSDSGNNLNLLELSIIGKE
ncbi:hypothetical protein INQ51_18985 [Maribellus sp. CM-23]|uniref:DUF4998 domain-containing protein n=1 Tax=Maribellus sp. CM-23 TaxID=2781026 RepID=UPI001F31A596|nr:DUF4998 domain-containing protein [Maribellus sp. CM-23]MCE4566413.1 hypothetical protein [Maribellus sp. CM-23]